MFREFYYPLKTPKALEFGIAFHKAMERWYDPELWNRPDHDELGKALALSDFAQTTKDQLKEYRRLNGEPDPEAMADYKARGDLGLQMIRYYIERISPQLDIGFTPIGVEVPFEVPLGFRCTCAYCFNKWREYTKATDGLSWRGLPVTYGGRIDMVAVDVHDRLWIFDWKTTARILDETAEASFLELDDQITSYVTALWKLGRPVAGFVYHEQRKAIPEPPKPLLRKMGGRAYSTAKNQNTDYALFRETIMNNDALALEQGAYDEYLNWLKTEGPRYWQRHQITRNQTELENAWDNMVAEAHDIIDNPQVYPQPGRFSCPTCAFRQPCLGANMGEDYQLLLDTLFEKRDKHYFEVRSTE